MTVFYFEPAAYGMLSDDVTRYAIPKPICFMYQWFFKNFPDIDKLYYTFYYITQHYLDTKPTAKRH